MSADRLYQNTVLDHWRNPRNRRQLKKPSVCVEHENPACGDRLQLQVELTGEDIVKHVAFDGEGCAISIASASLMTEYITGKSRTQALSDAGEFLQIMEGRKEPEALDSFGDCAALRGVIPYPIRVKCATLPWRALQRALGPEAGRRT